MFKLQTAHQQFVSTLLQQHQPFILLGSINLWSKGILSSWSMWYIPCQGICSVFCDLFYCILLVLKIWNVTRVYEKLWSSHSVLFCWLSRVPQFWTRAKFKFTHTQGHDQQQGMRHCRPVPSPWVLVSLSCFLFDLHFFCQYECILTVWMYSASMNVFWQCECILPVWMYSASMNVFWQYECTVYFKSLTEAERWKEQN